MTNKTFNAYALRPDRLNEEFARGWLNTPESAFRRCTCGRSERAKDAPRVLEWTVEKYEDGSEKIGDFTWIGSAVDALVSDRVRKIIENAGGCSAFFSTIEMRDATTPDEKRPHVTLPYTGPPLWDLRVNSWCNLDLEETGVSVRSVCSSCGFVTYKFPPEGDLVVDPTTWDGSPVFIIREFRMIFFVDRLLTEFKNMEINNFIVGRAAVVPTTSER